MADKNVFEKIIDALNTPLPTVLNKSPLPTHPAPAQAKEAPKPAPAPAKAEDAMVPAADLHAALVERDNALREAKEETADNEELRKQVEALRAELDGLRRDYEKAQANEAKIHAETEDWTYTVVRGDTLSAIAKRFYGKAGRWPEIQKANKDKIPNANLIYPGQVLVIPRD